LMARDKNDMTPLHWMVTHGAQSLISEAISKGADVNAINYAFQTPLWFAVTKMQPMVAQTLIDAGADVGYLDDQKRSMLHLAMQYGGGLEDSTTSVALLQLLLKARKLDVNVTDREKRTPLHWAAGKNALDSVTLLLESGADVNAKDWGGHTPMHWACPMDAVDSARALAKAGAKIDLVDRDKRTPLHWAADKGAERCVRFLLEEAGAAVDAVDNMGYSALHFAARRGVLSCVKLLLEKGANLNLATLSGENPSELASDEETRKALTPAKPSGLKRRRSSSANGGLHMEGTLPTLAEAFYAAVAQGDLTAVRSMCAESVEDRVAAQASGTGALKGAIAGTVHVSSRTASLHVDLKLSSGAGAVHKLTFDEEGLITVSDILASL